MDLQLLSVGSEHPNGIDGEVFKITKRERIGDEIYIIATKVGEDEPIKEI